MMRQHSFTAQELYCMAFLCKQKKMYGIPDGFHAYRESVRAAALQRGCDQLLEAGIAVMDMDGNITLDAEYHDYVSFICTCDKCLTVNSQRGAQGTISIIFWQHRDRYLMAEVMNERYILTVVDPILIDAIPNTLTHPTCNKTQLSATVPHIALTKAKRHCVAGRTDEAVRILRQNGASEEIACMIADGLGGTAYFTVLVYMDNRQGDCRKTKTAFLSNRGLSLRLGHSVENLRTCTTFSAVSDAELPSSISDIFRAFLSTEV